MPPSSSPAKPAPARSWSHATCIARAAARDRSSPSTAAPCPGLSRQAELFGHQAGSFTGATETREGWFEAANGGTLFLDEVGDLPMALQAKLLRVLQEREIVRVGSRRAVPLDVRVIAGTNDGPTRGSGANHFRMDLYYSPERGVAAGTHACRTPRRHPAAGGSILDTTRMAERLHAGIPTRSLPEAQRALLDYAWPGNIRELENVVTRGTAHGTRWPDNRPA